MRLVCPNCGAQYEVPDGVVPPEGREVQCSNCGDAWFQHHPDHAPAEDELTSANEPDDWDASEDYSEGNDQTPHEAEAPSAAEPEDHDDEAAEPEQTEAPQRQELDAAVSDVLRQEASREVEARAAEGEQLETQPDLGLQSAADEPSQREREAKLRMARMRGQTDEDAAIAAGAASRRDLLPDIEEINSTLRKSSDERPTEIDDRAVPGATRAKRSGFARGFVLILILAVLLLAVYVFADKLAALVPALEPVLDGFVSWVDGLRLWLDGQMESLMLWLDNQAAAPTAEPAAEPAPATDS